MNPLEIQIEYACTFTITEEKIKINQIISILYELMKDALKAIAAQLYRQLEDAFYLKHLGGFKQGKRRRVEGMLPFRCPRCGEEHHFSYHGFFTKPRRLQIRWGEVLLPARRIVCGRCKHHFSPFLQLLGVEPYMRRAADLKDMVASLVCDLSFCKVREAFKTLLGYVVSRRWIHKTVKEYEVDFGHNEEAFGYMVDGTGENVCAKKRGKELRLIGEITRYGKLIIRSAVIQPYKSSWDSLVEILRKTKTQRPLVEGDGDEGIREAVFKGNPNAVFQRCRWHVLHHLKWLFWNQGVPKALRREVFYILYNALKMRKGVNFSTVNQGIITRKGGYLLALAGWMDEKGYRQIGDYIREASLYVFSIATRMLPTHVRWDSSIGKMERLMRELNIRTDIGGARWSEEGLLRVIRLKCAKLTNPDAWQKAMKFKPTIDSGKFELEMAA